MTDPADILACALAGDEQVTRERLGMTQLRVVVEALRLADDPDVAVAYPVEVAAIPGAGEASADKAQPFTAAL